MAFLIKSMVGNPLKNIGLGGGEEKTEEAAPSDPAAAAGMTREEYEEYQKQLVEEKMQRDADFLHKKAERATLRTCLREKYRLPKVRRLSVRKCRVYLELLKMVDEDAEEEEEKDSILGQIQNIQNMDMDQIKEKAQATLTEMKAKAEEKCSLM
ncbi:complexin-4-like [Scleropages formosus]|uniref:Complexin-4-like n=1 Tax=Scleropages formosus TaxID=113540 RepID=A0A0N8JX20_SCLFO|nr:complexin-4-like [Scleropages formosus]